MNKEELKKLVNNPAFIPGIYNYCDRWCERCTMTTRCSLYAREQAESDRELDMNNEAFWKQLSSEFALAMEMLQDYCDEHDIDVSAEPDEGIIKQEKESREAAENHSASQKSDAYATKVGEWFKEKEGAIDLKTQEWETVANLGLAEKPMAEANEVKDLFEIIHWYRHQIYIKIMRAVQSKFDPFEMDDPVQNDANGSAKVALLGIKRSMVAWGNLLNHFPDLEGSILSLLVLLEQTKNHVQKTFPDTHKFVRPGFDE